MVYKVNEVFRSVQGEGIDTGRSAVFIRLAGCSVWCDFCDTDHTCKFKAKEQELIRMVTDLTTAQGELVVITGGEPLEQNCRPLYTALSSLRYDVTFETSGTVRFPAWCPTTRLNVSPKGNWHVYDDTCVRSLKLLYPFQERATPWDVRHFDALWYGIQPIDGVEGSFDGALTEVRRYGPPWRVSVQTHKLVGVR